MGNEDEPGDAGVSDAVGRYVETQCGVILSADAPLRRAEDVVHETRVAVRRLYSTLRTFETLLEPSEANSFVTELSWYAGLLGAVRDREVQRARLSAAVAALPSELVLGPVAEHIDQQLASELSFHRVELARSMDDDRYSRLLDSLRRWAGQPPYATLPADPQLLTRLARKAARKADRRLHRAVAHEDASPDERAAALHRARKAAKRARYAAELVEPLGGDRATSRIKHFKQVQSVLGDHQDSVVAAELLRRLGAGAGTMTGHNGFTYGVLYQLEVQAGETARQQAASI